MKLAEALVLRADTQKRIEQMRERLRLSVLVQEGEKPPEEPGELLSELDRLLNQFGELIVRINKTNGQTELSDGKTLTEALAQRDVLKLRYSIMSSVAEMASTRVERYSRSEIRKVSMVDVSELRHQLDEIARERRELDTAIQALNWQTDLLE